MTELETELAREHRAAFGWALACCRWDRGLAEDVLQTAYLRVIDGSARFRGDGPFRTFLFGVIRRVAAGERRKRALRSLLPLGEAPAAALEAPGDVASSVIRNETSQRLVDALRTLSPRQRDVLHLVFYQDLTVEQAADVLGIGVGSARVHYARGKARLRQLLEDDR